MAKKRFNMSDKRFTVYIRFANYKTLSEIELFDNGRPLLTSGAISDVQRIHSLLNELNDENEQLKKDVDFFKGYKKDVEELAVENEQLKQTISELKKEIEEWEADWLI